MSSNARRGSSPLSRTIRPQGTLRHYVLAALLLAGQGAALGACDSPADVVLDAADAARAGDRGAYLACLTPRSRAVVQALWHAADAVDPDLSRLGAGTVEVTGVQAMPPLLDGRARARVTTREGQQTLPVVLHQTAGAWRIDVMDTERALTGFGTPF